MDVASNLRVWPADPGPPVSLAAPSPCRGRPRTRLHAQAGAGTVKVDALTGRHFAAQSREFVIRQTAKGELRARLWCDKVWAWDGTAPTARARLLVVRQKADGTFKYSLSNAAATTPWKRLALYAGAALLDRTRLPGRQERARHGSVRGARLGGLAPSYGAGLPCPAVSPRGTPARPTQLPLLSARDIVDCSPFICRAALATKLKSCTRCSVVMPPASAISIATSPLPIRSILFSCQSKTSQSLIFRSRNATLLAKLPPRTAGWRICGCAPACPRPAGRAGSRRSCRGIRRLAGRRRRCATGLQAAIFHHGQAPARPLRQVGRNWVIEAASLGGLTVRLSECRRSAGMTHATRCKLRPLFSPPVFGPAIPRKALSC
jgi:hypothetical protein